MTTTRTYTRRPAWIAPGFTLLLLLSPTVVHAEDQIDWGRDPILPNDLDAEANAAGAAYARAHRIPLFRITPGFLSNPVGLTDQDDLAAADDCGLDWLQVAMGSDNPFFDLRRPGDPGGVGYYKVHTQVRLFDSPTTGCALGLQAVTPAGREFDGLDDGPTVVSPSLSLFHALDDGTAIQGFVGKNVNLNTNWTTQLGQSVQYGMAVQHPLVQGGPDGAGNLYVFVEALGRYHYDGPASSAPQATWEMLPGIHYRLTPNWWMAGGVVVPVTTPRPEANQWQFTCSFRF